MFVDISRRRRMQLPSPLEGIPRVSSIKILGVTVSNHLSVREHVASVIVGKLLYAVSAWWGFTSAADRQRLEALIKRGIRIGVCSPDIPTCTLTDMAKSIDDALFQRIMYIPKHVIHHLFPARREHVYNIRPRHYDRQLTIVFRQLRNRNFIHRMLFKDCY